VFGRPSAWPCFATRHALVLLRVHQAGSSTVIVEWDVAERRIRRWEYGKAAGHLLSVFGTSLDVLAEPVLAAASLDNCGIEPLLRLAEASVEHRTGFRLPLADARTTPDDGPAFLDALKPVRVDGARIERLWASDDVDKVDLIILGVFEAILAEIERSEAALDPATLERPGFLAALCAAIGRARGLVAGLVAGGALDLLPKQMRAALLGMLEPPGGDGQGGSLAA